MVTRDVVGSGEGVEEEDGVGFVVVQFAPSGVGELRRGNTLAIPESEIAERKEGGCGVRHRKRKTLNKGIWNSKQIATRRIPAQSVPSVTLGFQFMGFRISSPGDCFQGMGCCVRGVGIGESVADSPEGWDS